MNSALELVLLGAMPAAERELHLAVDIAIHRWQSVERQLEVVFSSAADLAPIEVGDMFRPIHSWKTKVDLTDVVVRTAMGDDDGWQRKWVEIREILMELAGDRNFMAHNGLVMHWSGGGQPVPKIGCDTRRQLALDVDAVAELALDFHHAYVSLLYVDSCVRNGRSSRDKHRELQIRRRPARSKRLAEVRSLNAAKASAAIGASAVAANESVDRQTTHPPAADTAQLDDMSDWLSDVAKRFRTRPSAMRREQPD